MTPYGGEASQPQGHDVMSASLPATTPANWTKPRRKRRRWLGYSLRTLLVLITVFSVWLGIKVDQARRQKRAVEALKALGAEIAYAHQYVSGEDAYDTTIAMDVPAWTRELCGDDFFRTVKAVWLRQSEEPGISYKVYKVTDDDLRCLADLPYLEWLEIYDAPISTARIRELQKTIPGVQVVSQGREIK